MGAATLNTLTLTHKLPYRAHQKGTGVASATLMAGNWKGTGREGGEEKMNKKEAFI